MSRGGVVCHQVQTSQRLDIARVFLWRRHLSVSMQIGSYVQTDAVPLVWTLQSIDSHSYASNSVIGLRSRTNIPIFSARYHIYWAAYFFHHYQSPRSPVCLSVRPSQGRISQKRLELGLWNFHRTIAPSIYFCRLSFIQKFRTGSPEWGVKRASHGENKPFSSFMRQYRENGRKYVQRYY